MDRPTPARARTRMTPGAATLPPAAGPAARAAPREPPSPAAEASISSRSAAASAAARCPPSAAAACSGRRQRRGWRPPVPPSPPFPVLPPCGLTPSFPHPRSAFHSLTPLRVPARNYQKTVDDPKRRQNGGGREPKPPIACVQAQYQYCTSRTKNNKIYLQQ